MLICSKLLLGRSLVWNVAESEAVQVDFEATATENFLVTFVFDVSVETIALEYEDAVFSVAEHTVDAQA